MDPVQNRKPTLKSRLSVASRDDINTTTAKRNSLAAGIATSHGGILERKGTRSSAYLPQESNKSRDSSREISTGGAVTHPIAIHPSDKVEKSSFIEKLDDKIADISSRRFSLANTYTNAFLEDSLTSERVYNDIIMGTPPNAPPPSENLDSDPKSNSSFKPGALERIISCGTDVETGKTSFVSRSDSIGGESDVDDGKKLMHKKSSGSMEFGRMSM